MFDLMTPTIQISTKQHSSVIWLCWLKDGVFVNEQSGCRFEFHCSHLNVSDITPVLSKGFLDIQGIPECRFTLNEYVT